MGGRPKGQMIFTPTAFLTNTTSLCFFTIQMKTTNLSSSNPNDPSSSGWIITCQVVSTNCVWCRMPIQVFSQLIRLASEAFLRITSFFFPLPNYITRVFSR